MLRDPVSLFSFLMSSLTIQVWNRLFSFLSLSHSFLMITTQRRCPTFEILYAPNTLLGKYNMHVSVCRDDDDEYNKARFLLLFPSQWAYKVTKNGCQVMKEELCLFLKYQVVFCFPPKMFSLPYLMRVTKCWYCYGYIMMAMNQEVEWDWGQHHLIFSLCEVWRWGIEREREKKKQREPS